MENVNGVLHAAEELRAPIILQVYPRLMKEETGYFLSPIILAAAKRATVPVVVHYDHGLTFERCMEALQLGFSSIMFDGSAGDYDKNIADTREIVKIAHSFGATVEGEIGHVGQADAGDNDASDMYTKVEEAVAYAQATGVDALAVSIGTAHGAYKSKPKLDLQRLSDIRDALDIPLVLHGGSGLTDDDFRNSIASGIAKVNIFTDLCLAGNRAMQKGLEQGKAYLDIRNMKVEEIKKEVIKKMLVFGCNGRY
jgi:fructose-bisphosphate aldolase class II